MVRRRTPGSQSAAGPAPRRRHRGAATWPPARRQSQLGGGVARAGGYIVVWLNTVPSMLDLLCGPSWARLFFRRYSPE